MSEYTEIEECLRSGEPLPDKLRAIVRQLFADDASAPALRSLLYWIEPPTIEQFLSEQYIGPVARILSPYWVRDLKAMLSPGAPYKEWVISGAIGIGKTTVARIAHAYNLTRVMCLRRPQETLGVPPDTLLVLALFSVTQDKAALALIKPFVALLQQNCLFEPVRFPYEYEDVMRSGRIPYIEKRDVIELPNNTIVMAGATFGHSLSYSMFGALLDEAEFRRGGAASALELYKSLKERVRSRFLDSSYTLLTLVSSSKYTTGVIAEYTKEVRNDPSVLYSGYAIWDIKEFAAYRSGYFYVMRGTRTHPSRILDADEQLQYEQGIFQLPPNCEILKVPEIFRGDFENRIDEALRNLAGVQTLGVEFLFDDLESIEYDYLLPELHLQAPLFDHVPLIHKLPTALFAQSAEGPRLARYPNAPRYIHIDLAETAEAGISMGHKEVGQDGRTVYVTDFTAVITSPTRIDLEAIENLVIDLRKTCGVALHTVSSDQFQSTAMRQTFERHQVAKNIKLVSVDRTADAYIRLAKLIHHRSFAVGRCPKLKAQLQGIMIENNKPVTEGRKDMADSVAGWVFCAINAIEDQPVYPFIADVFKRAPDTLEAGDWEAA